ncbi:3'-5' exonuclease [bacterium]|nr:3'-5' exonuclease [bacterium]
MNFVAIDFETADYGADSACSVGLVKVENGMIVGEMVRLIRPPRQDFKFTYIHGLSWNDVRGEPSFRDHWPDLYAFMKGADFLVAHNAPFDRKVLTTCCEVAGITDTIPEFKCTVQVARKQLEIHPAKLSNVCEVLGIELNHHEALSDARACAKIMLEAYRRESLAADQSC